MTRIVAVHGFLGNSGDWQNVKTALLQLVPDVDFQTVDLFAMLPNMKEKTLQDWAKKFNRAQKNRHVERNILIGYSLGGRLALQAAFDKPGLWDEVALVSAHPGLGSEDDKNKRRQADLDWANKFLNMPWQDVVRMWNGQPLFLGSTEPTRNETEYSRESLASALVNWSLSTQDFVADKISPLKPKLHWFAGEKDGKYVDLFHNLKVDGFIEDVVIIKGASHRVIFDTPEELARQLVQRLKLN
jgi:2-succinyl-6-hydroxy-2,4-cyclohexadiene-1-carboxylate synthase